MSTAIIPIQRITRAIYMLRGQKVLLDFDLAVLYAVSTKALNQAVKRNRERFPDDFMFQLSTEETRSLRSQFATLDEQTGKTEGAAKNRSQIVTGFLKHRERKSRPYAFTEQGVETNRELARKFEQLERRVGKHDEEIAAILDAIRQLMGPSKQSRREIGFHVREKGARYRVRNGR